MYTVCYGGIAYDRVDYFVEGQYQGSDLTFIGFCSTGGGARISSAGGGAGGGRRAYQPSL